MAGLTGSTVVALALLLPVYPAVAGERSSSVTLKSFFGRPKQRWFSRSNQPRDFFLKPTDKLPPELQKKSTPELVARMAAIAARVNGGKRGLIPGLKTSGFKKNVDVEGAISEALGIPAYRRSEMFSGKPLGMQIVDPFFHKVLRDGPSVVLVVDQTLFRNEATKHDQGNAVLQTIVNRDPNATQQYTTTPKLTPVKAGGLWFVEFRQTGTWHRHVTHEIAVFATEALANNFVLGAHP